MRPPPAALLLCCLQDCIAWLAPGASSAPWRARGRLARFPRVPRLSSAAAKCSSQRESRGSLTESLVERGANCPESIGGAPRCPRWAVSPDGAGGWVDRSAVELERAAPVKRVHTGAHLRTMMRCRNSKTASSPQHVGNGHGQRLQQRRQLVVELDAHFGDRGDPEAPKLGRWADRRRTMLYRRGFSQITVCSGAYIKARGSWRNMRSAKMWLPMR